MHAKVLFNPSIGSTRSFLKNPKTPDRTNTVAEAIL